MLRVVGLVLAIALNALAHLLIRASAQEAPSDVADFLRRLVTDGWFIGGATSFALSLVAYTYALAGIPVHLAYPALMGGALLIIVFASAIFFGESIRGWQIVGALLILGGATLMVQQSGGPTDP